ncbi:hypothetical protein KCTC52924_03744 [Arenibacter antarcticus]
MRMQQVRLLLRKKVGLWVDLKHSKSENGHCHDMEQV